MNGTTPGTPMPPMGGPPPSGNAADQLKIPGIILIIFGMLGFLNQVWTLIRNRGVEQIPNLDQIPPEFRGVIEQSVTYAPAIGVVALIVSAFVALGGFQMLKRKSWGLAVTGAALASIPCLSPCCCLALPFGVWALVLLLKPEVKASFASHGGMPPSGGGPGVTTVG